MREVDVLRGTAREGGGVIGKLRSFLVCAARGSIKRRIFHFAQSTTVHRCHEILESFLRLITHAAAIALEPSMIIAFFNETLVPTP